MSIQTIAYASGQLDRAANNRKDESWLAARLAHSDALLIPVWRDRNHVTDPQHGPPRCLRFTQLAKHKILNATRQHVFLGLCGDQAVFAADLTSLDEPQALELTPGGVFLDMRAVGPLLDPQEAALMAYARGLLHWHRHYQFCSRCGNPTRSSQGGHVRQCSNLNCARQSFPRIDPAVIMLVEARRGDGTPVCLLGRNQRFPKGTFSTLAGFVEPGESLEDAVAREVFEEAGIEVNDIRYRGSQPWPFPASIMLGFWARAEYGEIKIDHDEIAEAQWFSSAQLQQFGEWGDNQAAFCMPRKDSIARYLIDTWLAAIGA